jgi:hypothetical protein
VLVVGPVGDTGGPPQQLFQVLEQQQVAVGGGLSSRWLSEGASAAGGCRRGPQQQVAVGGGLSSRWLSEGGSAAGGCRRGPQQQVAVGGGLSSRWLSEGASAAGGCRRGAQQQVAVGGGLMESDHTYKVPGASGATGLPPPPIRKYDSDAASPLMQSTSVPNKPPHLYVCCSTSFCSLSYICDADRRLRM